MKKIINDPTDVVDQMLDGFVAAHSGQVRRLPEEDVIVRAESPVEGKVGVVTGGGSGHEPMHTGYVGKGMLDGAAAGEIFTSPSADEMSQMIESCDGGEGVLLVIKNYEGDIMNFEVATDLTPEIETARIIVDDDVAVSEAEDRTGRRGVAGTVLVHKTTGAKAAQGATLEEVTAVGEKTIENMASMGVALTSCITPGKGEPTVDLEEDEIELGIGIHGEPGVERTEIRPADEITDALFEPIINDIDVDAGDECVALINGLGGTPLSELYIVHRRLQQQLDHRGIELFDAWIGEYCTSLDMEGCSITLLALDEELRELVSHPVDTPELTIADND
jgi:dihydroxyacetone kinase-like protein